VRPSREEPLPIVSETRAADSSPSHIAILPDPQPADDGDQIIPDMNMTASQSAHVSQEPMDAESAIIEPEVVLEPIAVKEPECSTTRVSESEVENTGSSEDLLQTAPVSVEVAMECPSPPMSPVVVKEDAVQLRHSPGSPSREPSAGPRDDDSMETTSKVDLTDHIKTPVEESAGVAGTELPPTMSTSVEAEVMKTIGEFPSTDPP
jgi:hypothetical protein